MNAIDKVKKLLTKDGAKIIRVDLYGDILVVVASHSSLLPLKRFQKTGDQLNLFDVSDIEIREKGVVFSAGLNCA